MNAAIWLFIGYMIAMTAIHVLSDRLHARMIKRRDDRIKELEDALAIRDVLIDDNVVKFSGGLVTHHQFLAAGETLTIVDPGNTNIAYITAKSAVDLEVTC